jgi:purine-nucleoside phosphorylase
MQSSLTLHFLFHLYLRIKKMSKDFYSYQELKEAADYIQSNTKHRPEIALILGSGLSPLAAEVEEADILPYQEIPHFAYSTVPGHAGRLVIGRLAGQPVMVMQGRSHFYEGYSIQQITLPVRVMKLLGIKTLIVTNAAGGINSGLRVGDLMLINDHLNLVGMAGPNPLRGPNLDELGPRFPSMTQPYDLELIQLAHGVAEKLGMTLQEGVYAYLAGPSFETPAEIRYLKTIGADAVGMSTVPETIVARHSDIRVLGISTITNVAIQQLGSGAETTHEEVLETGKQVVPRLMSLLKGVLAELS